MCVEDQLLGGELGERATGQGEGSAQVAGSAGSPGGELLLAAAPCQAKLTRTPLAWWVTTVGCLGQL